jgi:hypothetical protein
MVTVGIDPHKHVHVAVAVGADGKRLSRPLTVKNDTALIGALLTRTRGRPRWTAAGSRAHWPTSCCWRATKWSRSPPG